jgi:hypothetical protein
MLPIAMACTKHAHAQVSGIGKRAVAAIRGLK